MCRIILDLGKWIMRCHLTVVVFLLRILSQEDILFSEAYCYVYAILVEGIMCNLFESILKLIQMLFKGKVCAQQTTNDDPKWDPGRSGSFPKKKKIFFLFF